MVIVFAAPARSQKISDTSRALADTRRELARIREDLTIVRSQLGEVLRLLNRAPAPARSLAAGPVRVNVAGAPTLGRSHAPVTLVEFTDYQCPFCQRFFATTLRALIAEYVDSGKVRYVLRDNPLDQLHPNARKAAEAAHCAGDQGRYWAMHDVLFSSGGALAPAELATHARVIGLDSAQFDECLASGRHAVEVQQGIDDGAAAGVRGTPSFVIGLTRDGDVVEGTPVRGAQPIESFRRIIDQALRGRATDVRVRREAAAPRPAQVSAQQAFQPHLPPTRRCLNAHVCAPLK
jgi:protein-disulfide isomerase